MSVSTKTLNINNQVVGMDLMWFISWMEMWRI